MKKVGLIASLACLFTVGGVYATWTYATGGVAPVEKSFLTQMAAVGEASNKGTIHVDTDELKLVIDQQSSASYLPVRKLEGHVDVWFVPNPGASESVKTQGIPMKLNITQSDDWIYDPHELDQSKASSDAYIFEVSTSAVVLNGGLPVLQDAEHPLVIDAADIEHLITLLVQEEIDTIDEWTYFDNLLRSDPNKFFTVTVSENI